MSQLPSGIGNPERLREAEETAVFGASIAMLGACPRVEGHGQTAPPPVYADGPASSPAPLR